MVLKADDQIIYGNAVNQDEFFEYVKTYARNYRDPSTENTENTKKTELKIVALSTCSYAFNNARTVLLATMSPVIRTSYPQSPGN